MKHDEPQPHRRPKAVGTHRPQKHRFLGIGYPTATMRADDVQRVDWHAMLDPDVLAALDKFAAAHGRSPSIIVEGLIRHFLGLEQLPEWMWLPAPPRGRLRAHT
jgi:hypothetical protein